jgi:hypothetical protein
MSDEAGKGYCTCDGLGYYVLCFRQWRQQSHLHNHVKVQFQCLGSVIEYLDAIIPSSCQAFAISAIASHLARFWLQYRTLASQSTLVLKIIYGAVG